MHIAVHGVALHEVRRHFGRCVHVVVGDFLKHPRIDHGGRGIGDVGVVAESDKIWRSGVVQKVKVEFDLVMPLWVCGVARLHGGGVAAPVAAGV